MFLLIIDISLHRFIHPLWVISQIKRSSFKNEFQIFLNFKIIIIIFKKKISNIKELDRSKMSNTTRLDGSYMLSVTPLIIALIFFFSECVVLRTLLQPTFLPSPQKNKVIGHNNYGNPFQLVLFHSLQDTKSFSKVSQHLT